MNIAAINYCRNIFKIDIPVIRSSELNVAGIKAERIYNICKALVLYPSRNRTLSRNGISPYDMENDAFHNSRFSPDRTLGADVYVAGLGSREYMMDSDFREIEVQYFYPRLNNYESAIVQACSADIKLLPFLETIKNATLFCKGG